MQIWSSRYVLMSSIGFGALTTFVEQLLANIILAMVHVGVYITATLHHNITTVRHLCLAGESRGVYSLKHASNIGKHSNSPNTFHTEPAVHERVVVVTTEH
jgi:hypothetical protein